jgi:RNA polymerase sigma-70 factor (ECF subfamily)
MIQDSSTVFAGHLDWLHRWFVSRGVDAATADDLVQLTLIEAWRNLAKLEQPEGMQPWLRAIAQHILRRWWRTSAREARFRHMAAYQGSPQINDVPDDRWPDLSTMLEHEDLAAIVADALGQLPGAVRYILKARYQDNMSVTDLAGCIGITPAHMAVRLQRAREQVRAVLSRTHGHQLAAYCVGLEPVTWRSTRLWCPLCGTTRLSMELDAQEGTFALTCPHCTSGPDAYLYNWRLMDDHHGGNPLGSARSAVQALERTLHASVWKIPQVGQRRHCPRCQAHVTCRAILPPFVADEPGSLQVEMWCPACGPLHASATYGGMAAFHPQGMAFWQDHQRISLQPPVRMTFEQTDAIRVDLVGVSSSATTTFVFSDGGERLLQIIPNA